MSLVVVKHPLIESKMTMLRNQSTGSKEFRELVEELSLLLCYEATRDMPLTNIEIETPLCPMNGQTLAGKWAIVPILRAGIGMCDGMSKLLPTAKIGHIGLYRDPSTLRPVEYYCKLPSDISERDVFLLDPMLATGGTASAAATFLKERGVKNIKLLCLIACPQGAQLMEREHPDVEIYTSAYDRGLNEHGYIVPGLGDAGDRIFGTK